MLKKTLFWFCICFFAYNNYVKTYWFPIENIWDETFHVPAAVKYIKGVYFMEAHPPLGKLLIAAGEVLTRPLTGQEDTYGLENVEEGSALIRAGYTSFGFRLFPVLFSFINAILFTLILLEIFKSQLTSLLFSCLYLFENSLISQARAAMLDNFLIFGILLSLLSFFKLLQCSLKKDGSKYKIITNSLLLAFGFSFAILTKAFGFILLLLWPLLFYFKNSKNERSFYLKMLIPQFLIVFIFFNAIWLTHFKLATKINPQAPNNGLYYASDDLKKILLKQPHNMGALESYWVQLRDNYHYFFAYEKMIPPLNTTLGSKNGSFPTQWPFGSKPINYWYNNESQGEEKLLAFVPNPFHWILALMSLILVPGILFIQGINGFQFFSKFEKESVQTLLFLYLGFMTTLIQVRRILYLNHYIIPLLFSFIIFAVFWSGIKTKFQQSKQKFWIKNIEYGLCLFSLLAFLFFKPLTYGEPMSCADMNKRFFIRHWDMSHPACKNVAEQAHSLDE